MSDFARFFLIILTGMAYMTALISWLEQARVEYMKKSGSKIKFIAAGLFHAATVAIGSICSALALWEWLK